jgi:hypothetical protein
MKIVICHTADSKPVKQEVNSTVILSPLLLLALSIGPWKKSLFGLAAKSWWMLMTIVDLVVENLKPLTHLAVVGNITESLSPSHQTTPF